LRLKHLPILLHAMRDQREFPRKRAYMAATYRKDYKYGFSL